MLNWKSEDENIVEVHNGIVEAKKSGTTTVKVYANNTLLDECKIIVKSNIENKEVYTSEKEDELVLNRGLCYLIKNTSDEELYFKKNMIEMNLIYLNMTK